MGFGKEFESVESVDDFGQLNQYEKFSVGVAGLIALLLHVEPFIE